MKDRDTSDPQSLLGRREFLKTTGAVVVGFSVAAELSAAQSGAPAPRGTVSGPFDEAEIDSYVAIHPDNKATIFSGYVELGQGGPTALRQIAAEELDLEFDQVLMVPVDTFVSTDGFTAASMTVAIGGTKLRAAAAEARRVLLGLASDRLKAPAQDLIVTKGVVSVRSDPQRSVTYGALLGDKRFNRKYEPIPYQGIGLELPRKNPDNAPAKPRDGVPDRRHAGAAIRSSRQGQRQVRVHAACPRSRDAPRARRVAPGTRRVRRQHADGDQHRRTIDQEHSGSADRSPKKFRGCDGGT